jgi:hypothetical protein
MPCVDRNKLVYNIKELPEVFNVEPVDLFIVETLDGTNIVSFDNIIFDLTQTTFETAFNKHTTDIQTLSADVELLTNNSGSGYDHAELESSYSTVKANSANWSTVTTPTPIDALLADIGYEVLPSGRIIQWGVLTPNARLTNVTLPTPFPNKCLNVQVSWGQDFTDTFYNDNSLIWGGYPGNSIGTELTTKITIMSNLKGETSLPPSYGRLYWQAIGY